MYRLDEEAPRMATKIRPAELSLTAANVQEIQLELIRRAATCHFDGDRLVASLRTHRDLWEAVYIDRLCITRVAKIPYNALIKLRDLPNGYWNADILYVLTPSAAIGRKLAKVAKKDRWGGEQFLYDDPDELDAAIGGPANGKAVFHVWWD
jgi:hypothetical protein